MSILEKIKESYKKVFRKKKKKDDALLPFVYALDKTKTKGNKSAHVYIIGKGSNVVLKEILKSIKKSENNRLRKAKHIYSQTKNKRIKKKQLKIIASEELRREVQ